MRYHERAAFLVRGVKLVYRAVAYSPRWKCRATAAPDVLEERTSAPAAREAPHQLSYSQQYEQIFQKPLDTKRVVPKPSKEAQKLEPDGRKVLLSDVYGTQKTNLFKNRSWAPTDKQYVGFMLFIHGLCLAAPFTFSWPMVGLFAISYFITGCLGITLSYHRQLSHGSFQTPKWLEYTLAYCGVLAIQGEPMEWVSSHRYHHLHTDTPLDPHSPYEGFWWSHMGWLLDNKVNRLNSHASIVFASRVKHNVFSADVALQSHLTFVDSAHEALTSRFPAELRALRISTPTVVLQAHSCLMIAVL